MIKVVTTYVDDDIYDQIESWRKEWNVTMPEALRRLINLGLQSLGKNKK